MIVAIVGPTASGKSAVAFELAKIVSGEIVNADSRQIYKHVSAGTAQPSENARQTIPHHLYGFLEPNLPYNAGSYAESARNVIQEILARGKQPILVGGTGLYLKALFEGLSKLPQRDESIRAELLKFSEENGKKTLHDRLKKVDPDSAEKIPYQNVQRVARALEVYLLTQKPISHFHAHPTNGKPSLQGKFFGLHWPKEQLKERIHLRSRTILSSIVQETQALLLKGYQITDPALQSLGYKDAAQLIESKMSETELYQRLDLDTIHYAKRQITWFKRDAKIQWLHCSEPFLPRKTAEEIRQFMV